MTEKELKNRTLYQVQKLAKSIKIVDYSEFNKLSGKINAQYIRLWSGFRNLFW